jgi:hypothetical protein
MEEGSVVDPAMEQVAVKGVELFAESIPGENYSATTSLLLLLLLRVYNVLH